MDTKSNAAAYVGDKGGKFLKGGFAGGVAAVLLQPLDFLKSRHQYHYMKNGNAVLRVSTLVRRVVKNEGASALWKGVGPSLSRVCYGVGIYFCSLDYFCEKARRINGTGAGGHLAATILPSQSFLVGCLARTVATSVTLPVTVVKTRFEVSKTHSYRNTFDGVLKIFRQEGVRGLYSGFLPTLMRDVPYSGTYFALYKSLQGMVKKDQAAIPPTLNFGIGLAAGSIATLMTHPFDVIKTRMQIQQQTRLTGELRAYFRSIFSTEGSIGFTRGLFLRVLKRPLSTAITWTIYETFF